MRTSSILLLVLGSLVLVSPVLRADEPPPDPAKCASEGEALLRQADFEGALAKFLLAAHADPENPERVARARIVARVITLRKAVSEAEPDERLERMATSLHVFYHQNSILGEAESLDRMVYGARGNATTAALLAETLLARGKDREALVLLAGLADEQRTVQNRLYQGIALARLGKAEDAAALADATDPGDAPGTLLDAARLAALLDRPGRAAECLKKALETAPPSAGDPIRAFVDACPDFDRVRDVPGFTAARSTASKQTESGCSGGSDCGSCPSKDACK